MTVLWLAVELLPVFIGWAAVTAAAALAYAFSPIPEED